MKVAQQEKKNDHLTRLKDLEDQLTKKRQENEKVEMELDGAISRVKELTVPSKPDRYHFPKGPDQSSYGWSEPGKTQYAKAVVKWENRLKQAVNEWKINMARDIRDA